MLTSHDITTRKFERSALGGYKIDDVDGFITEIARSCDELEEQNKVLTKKLEVLAEKLEEYRSDEESLRAALLGAQKLGDSVIRESKNKAEIIMRDATIKADRLVNSARDQVEKEKMVYIKMQRDVAQFKNKLLAIYKQHLELISSLPEDPNRGVSEEEEQSAQEQQPAAPAQELRPEQQEEPAREEYRRRPEPQPEAESESGYDEPAPQTKKFIPVPHREEAVPQAEENKKSPYAQEYYEDLDEEEKPEDNSPQKKSRFGTLKFGAGYDLKRE